MDIGTCEIGCTCPFCLQEEREAAAVKSKMFGPWKSTDPPFGFDDMDDDFAPAAEAEEDGVWPHLGVVFFMLG